MLLFVSVEGRGKLKKKPLTGFVYFYTIKNENIKAYWIVAYVTKTSSKCAKKETDVLLAIFQINGSNVTLSDLKKNINGFPHNRRQPQKLRALRWFAERQQLFLAGVWATSRIFMMHPFLPRHVCNVYVATATWNRDKCFRSYIRSYYPLHFVSCLKSVEMVSSCFSVCNTTVGSQIKTTE